MWQVVHVPFSVAFTLPWSASFTPRTPGDADGLGVEDRLAARDRRAPVVHRAARQPGPGGEHRHRARIERGAERVAAVRVVDAEERLLRAQRLRPAGRAGQVQRAHDVVALLRDHQVHLEVDDRGPLGGGQIDGALRVSAGRVVGLRQHVGAHRRVGLERLDAAAVDVLRVGGHRADRRLAPVPHDRRDEAGVRRQQRPPVEGQARASRSAR